MDRYERLFKRLVVLTSWGFNGDFSGDFETAERYLATDEGLAKWFGHELEPAVQDELAAIDLVAGSNLTLEQ